MNIYFKNIRTINPAENLDKPINLWVKDGIILHCNEYESAIDTNTEIIDGSNLICTPGLFDMRVTIGEPGHEFRESIESGAEAAANGGFTGIQIMPNTTPIIDNITVFEFIRAKSRSLLVDVEVAAAVSQTFDEVRLTEMLELSEAGVTSFTDSVSIQSADMMRRAFDYAATRDLLIAQTCENFSLSGKHTMNESPLSYKLGLKGFPNVAEEIMLARDLMLAAYCGNRRYHAHQISTEGSLKLIRNAKRNGQRISSDVSPHHITLTEEKLNTYNSNYKINPPLRSAQDRLALIGALADGTIDCIASDHKPYELQEKDVEIENAPYGIIGLETSLALILTNLVHNKVIDYNNLVELMSINPRKVLKLKEIKIADGVIANLTIFNPDTEWFVDSRLFKSKATNTPFEGMKLKGIPVYTINNNKLYKCKLQ